MSPMIELAQSDVDAEQRPGAKALNGASAVRFSRISRWNMRDCRVAQQLLKQGSSDRHPWLLWYKDPSTERQFVVFMTQDINIRFALTSIVSIVLVVFIAVFAGVLVPLVLLAVQLLAYLAASAVLFYIKRARFAMAALPGAASIFESPSSQPMFERKVQLAWWVSVMSEAAIAFNGLFIVAVTIGRVGCYPFVTEAERTSGCYQALGWDSIVLVLMLFPVLLTPVRIVASTFCTILTVVVLVLANLVIAPEQLEYKRFWSSLAIVCAQAVMCIGASYVREAQLRKSFEHGLSRQRQTLELEAVRKLALEGAESLVPLQVLTSRIAGRARTATHYVVHFGLAGLAQWALCRGPCDVVWMLEQYNKTLERFMGTLRGGAGVSLELNGDLFVALIEAKDEATAQAMEPTAVAVSPAQEAANLHNALALVLLFLRDCAQSICGGLDAQGGRFLTHPHVCERFDAGGDAEVLPAASMDVGLVALHLHSTGRVIADGPVLARGHQLLVDVLEKDCTNDTNCLVVSPDFQRRLAPKWSFSNTASSNRESFCSSSQDFSAAPTLHDLPRTKSMHDLHDAQGIGEQDASISIDEQLRRSCFKGILAKFADPLIEVRYATFCRDGCASDFLFVLAAFFVLIAAVCVLICGIYGAWGWSERSPLPYFVAAGAIGAAEMLLAVVEPRAPRHRGVVHAAIEVLYYAFCGCLLFASLVSDMSVAVFGSSMLPMYLLVLLISFMRPLWHSPGVMLLLDVFSSVIPFVDVVLPNNRYLVLPSDMEKAMYPCGVLVMLVMRHVMDAAQRDRFVALEGARLAQEKVEKEYALLQVVVEQLAPKRIAALLVDRRKHASIGDGHRGGLHPLVSTAAASSADDLGFAVVRFFVPPSGGFQEWSALLLRLVQLLDGPATPPETTAVDGSECSTRNRAPLLVSASGDTMVVSSCRAGSAPTAENVTDVMDRVYEMGGIVAQHGGGGSRMSGYVGVCPLMGAMLPGPRVTYQLYGGELTAATAVVQRAWPLTAGMVVGSARACYYNAEHCRLATNGQRGALQPHSAGPSMRWRLRNVGTLHVHLLRTQTSNSVAGGSVLYGDWK